MNTEYVCSLMYLQNVGTSKRYQYRKLNYSTAVFWLAHRSILCTDMYYSYNSQVRQQTITTGSLTNYQQLRLDQRTPLI